MDGIEPETIDEQAQADTPEDVAVLYSWANLQGAKYRDFSASRREYRAQMRHRAAQSQRDNEIKAKQQAEDAAAAAEKAAREAEEAAMFHASKLRIAADSRRAQEQEIEEAAHQRAMRHAAELSRRAAAERMEAARRAEAVAAAEAAARREAREMAEARASAARQAQRYEASEFRRRSLAGPQPAAYEVPGEITDPYTDDHPQQLPGRIFHQPTMSEEDMKPQRHPQTRDVRLIIPQPDPSHPISEEPEYYASGTIAEDAILAAGGAAALAKAADQPNSPISYYYEPDPTEKIAAVDQYGRTVYEQAPPPVQAVPVAAPLPAVAGFDPISDAEARRRPQGFRPDEASGFHQPFKGTLGLEQPPAPAWLSAPTPEPPRAPEMRRPVASPVEDTLQHSKERVAARWYALKGVFDQTQEPPAEQVARNKEMRTPLLVIFSLAGGVGKTSMVATLGRALSASGERVLLTDTTSHGLLPFYFGASELRPGVVRTFSPPPGSADAPIALVSYDVMAKGMDATAAEWLVGELSNNSRGMQRILIDLAPSAAWLARRLAQLNSIILVPVAPDMNSVISLGSVEKFFTGAVDGEGRPVQPYYLLNQFDASLPLHLDVREVMRRQLGDRLLPFVVRRSQSVSEALAEGMTVMDYAPEASVATDYTNLASWLRSQSSPQPTAGFKNARWSER